MLGSCVYAEKSGSEPSTSQRKLVQMGRGRSTSPRVHQDGMLGSGRGELPRGLLMSCLRLFSLVIWTQKPGSLAWVLPIALQPLLEMQFQRALPGSRAMLHNSSLREGMAHVEADCQAFLPVLLSGFKLPAFRGLRQHHPSLLCPPGCCGPGSAGLRGLQVVGAGWQVPLHPTAGTHISKDSSWPRLGLPSWGASTGTRWVGIAASSWTLPAAWNPAPPTRDRILSLATDFTFISLGSSRRKWSSSWRRRANLIRAGRAWQAAWATRLRLWRPC
ncbi:uncharacterized protein PS065_020751 isoform 4-T6 [Dugong dugon]